MEGLRALDGPGRDRSGRTDALRREAPGRGPRSRILRRYHPGLVRGTEEAKSRVPPSSRTWNADGVRPTARTNAMNSRRVLALVSLVVAPVGLGWVACGGSGNSETTADGGNESGGGGATGTATCTFFDGGPYPYAVPAFGTVAGPDLNGNICVGGAFAYLQRIVGSATMPNQFIIGIPTGSQADFVRFKAPANATGGELSFEVGVSAGISGTNSSVGACGGGEFCIELPVPPSVDCADASPTTCPPGCEFMGPSVGPPFSSPICTPTIPEDCYRARGASDCVSGTQTPEGSWTVTLTSVVPYDGEDGGPGTNYVVHGSLQATLVGDDAGLGTAELSLSF
jgi:hypothetical protein